MSKSPTKIEYTPEQLEAIRDVDQHQLTVACAGSGKSTVIVARVMECLKHQGVTPENVVVLTYNNDAAESLQHRIADRVGSELGTIHGIGELFVGTIHSFCLNLLQNELYDFRKYSVLTESQAALLLTQNVLKSGMTRIGYVRGDRKGQRLGVDSGREDFDIFDDTKLYFQVISHIREENVGPEVLPANLQAALADYYALLDSRAFLDHARILHETVRQIERGCPQILRRLSEIKYLLVDEYQDVNAIQQRLIDEIAKLGAYITAVGDDDQLIYGWRGSNPDNMRSFPDRLPNVAVKRLQQNFRSTKPVIAAANAFGPTIGESRIDKTMEYPKGLVSERGDLLALDYFKSPDEEATWIAKRIQSMIGTPFRDKRDVPERGMRLNDFAILVRNWFEAEAIKAALDDAQIPYQVAGSPRLFDTPEGRAVLASFKYLAGQAEEADVESGWANIGLDVTPQEIESATAYLRAARSPNDPDAMLCLQTVFLDLLRLLNINEDRAEQHGVGVILENLARVSRAIADFQTINFRMPAKQKLKDFAVWLDRIAFRFEDSAVLREQTGDPAVVITTVHAAKGLEWPAVFLPALRKNKFPGKPRVHPMWDVIPDGVIADPERYHGRMEDERRLFYTAITRSKRYIFFTTDTGFSVQSPFFQFVAKLPYVERYEGAKPLRELLEPAEVSPVAEALNITITELKYHELCPHQFKLRYVYGFSSPIVEDIGYGESVHNACSEIHKRAITGETSLTPEEIADIVTRHVHLPYASDQSRHAMELSVRESVREYVETSADVIARTVMSEKPVSFQIDDVIVHGRIDLVTRNADNGLNIAELKTAKDHDTRSSAFDQLNLVSLGCEALVGEVPMSNEIVFMGQEIQRESVPVDDTILELARNKVRLAANGLKQGFLPPHLTLRPQCKLCDGRFVCNTWQRNGAANEAVTT